MRQVLLLLLALPAVAAISDDFNDKRIAEEIELDATWVDTDAHHKLDIVILLDESGSVGRSNYFRAKKWIRSFLDFFSISSQYTQVGLVSFASEAKVRISLNRGTTKCSFLQELDKIPYAALATNLGAGLRLTNQMLIQTSRADVPRKLIVVISDGWSTMGPEPFAEQQAIRARFPKSYFMVVAIGAANDYLTELSKLATTDSRGDKMLFALKDFKNFAHVAYYFHKGEQGSQLMTVSSSYCKNPSCDGSSKSFCACDSLGRGDYQCACEGGHYATTNKAANLDQCQACPIGSYSEKRSTRRTCKKCNDPEKETTYRAGSVSSAECVCKAGYVNLRDSKLKSPPCKDVSCPPLQTQQMDKLNVGFIGSACQSTRGSRCSFQCNYGHGVSKQDSLTTECQIDGQWSHAIPQCLPINCPQLTAASNSAGWKCVAKPGLKINQHGAECETSCNSGYKPRQGTSVYRICRADGRWSGNNPICEAKSCSELPEVENGIYSLPECSNPSGVRRFGIQCKVLCNNGFQLGGGKEIKYTCDKEGNWDNLNTQPECIDIQAPAVTNCPAHKTLHNDEGVGFARHILEVPKASDNSKQEVGMSVRVVMPDDIIDNFDLKQELRFPIGTSRVKFTMSDGAGNEAVCEYDVDVKDVEPPKVLSCNGPITKDSYIFTQDSQAFVTWEEPKFSDNSEGKIKVFKTGQPGDFGLSTHSISYIATDESGNRAECSFEFTVIGHPCPPLHVPYNGALVCDKMEFGTVCTPQCEAGLSPFYPDHIRPAKEYFCTLQGEWRPSHAYVPDCTLRESWDDDILLTYEGECDDENTRQQIKQSAFTKLQNSLVGKFFIESSGLTYDNLHVQCGTKNESIVKGGGRRRRSIAESDTLDMLAKVEDLPKVHSRAKRELTAAQLEALRKALGGNIKVETAPCPAGSEQRIDRGRKTCYKCPPGTFWRGATRKCIKCPVGSYSVKDATIDKCTPCAPGSSTAAEGSGNKTQCIEQCPPGHYSSNGLMSPVNCRTCPIGTYADKSGTKTCLKCPSRTTTSDPGAKAKSYCQAQCQPGFYSHNGVAPCKKCGLNTYQSRVGQSSCTKCPLGKTTLAQGSTRLSQCLVINECASNPCRNGGRCTDGNNKFICSCAPGWTGDRCETNIDDCASKPCWSDAACIDLVNDFRCKCPKGFQGKLCNIDINECKVNPCKNGGQCIDLEGDFECSCKTGYGGKTCQVNQDDCSPGICKNGGKCVDKLNGFLCQCAVGYKGEQCAENINDCQNHKCLNGATCVDGVNRYSCRCARGFTGTYCNVNIDDCRSRPCRNNGQCTDAVADFKCTCPSYWGGKTCTSRLSDCFNLDMGTNGIEDYVMYDPAYKIKPISEITVKFSMKSNDKGLNAHYGTIISYGIPRKEGLFNIRAFPEQMLQVNGEDWLTGIDMTNGQWNTVCMTWRASDGIWRAYAGAGDRLRQVTDDRDAAGKAMSKSKPIPAGGKFIIGQLYQGSDQEFSDVNIYQGELHGLTVWYKWDQCVGSSRQADIAWPNFVYNGKVVAATNSGMVKKGYKKGGRC